MRAVVLLSLLVACTAATDSLPDRQWVDLSHDYAADTVYWPTASGFELTVDARGMTEGGYWYEANSFRTAEHGGTHLDAPCHFAEGMSTVDGIAIERLVGLAVVLDLREACRGDRDYQVRVGDLETFEAAHGRIPDGAIVLLDTGFAAFWPDRERYMGTAERGLEATLRLSFPGLHPSAARWLVQQRSIKAVGIDTPSIDHGKSRMFHSHRELFKADIPAFENVANLDQLPPTGALVIALPMKIRGGSGGPLRIVAALPR